jgi:hypothetical protein
VTTHPYGKLLQSLPGSQFHPEARLLTWRPTGIFDDALADQVVELLESEAMIGADPFHAFTDFTGLTKISLSLTHVFRIAARRHMAMEPIKSAFLGQTFAAIGIARMYEELMADAFIQVRAFRDPIHAAAWLGVPLALLTPPPPA